MSYFTVVLKGEPYKIRNGYKTDTQRQIKEIDNRISNMKADIMRLQGQKKALTVDLLNDRQKIVYKNSYNKNLGSEELKNDERYKKQQDLLRKYDDEHGIYIEPE